MKKRLLMLVMGTMLTLSLVACGDGQENVSSNDTTIEANNDVDKEIDKEAGSENDEAEAENVSEDTTEVNTEDSTDEKAEDTTEDGEDATEENTDESVDANAETSLVGKWDYKGNVYTFNEDGTGTYLVMGTEMDILYSVEGNKLSVLFLMEGVDPENTSPAVNEFVLKGDELIITDSFGSELNFKKTE